MNDAETTAPDPLAALRRNLGTPIMRVLEYAQKLQEQAEEVSQEVFLPELYKIQSAVKQLLELVNELVGPWATKVDDVDVPRLRFEIRGALNHTVGYVEMLQERAHEIGQHDFLPDLEKMHGECYQLLESTKAPVPTDSAGALPSRRPPPGAAADGEVTPKAGALLVVDDNAQSRNHLGRELQRQGYRVVYASSGPAAMERIRAETFDLVLLDVVMPGMSGYEMLQWLKADEKLRDLPVMMISALNETESVVRCLVIGADDYIAKPCDPVLLNLRISACLARHQWGRQEQTYRQQIEDEKLLSERLLLSILPKPVADRLRQGEDTIVDLFPDVTLVFAHVVSFTSHLATLPATEMVGVLNDVFNAFDQLAEERQVEKVKTIGSTYVAVAGLNAPQRDHAAVIVDLALAMQRAAAALSASQQRPLHLRIGIHTGPVVAGIIGLHKFTYDLWGDTVEIASRLETSGETDRIHLSSATRDLVRDRHRFDEHHVDLKGHGKMTAYFLVADPTPPVA